MGEPRQPVLSSDRVDVNTVALRSAMRGRCMDVTMLAFAAEISRTAVRRALHGGVALRATLERIAEALGVSPEALVAHREDSP